MHKFKNERLLVIAPHPDDEAIGCAGLITKINTAGGKVFVLFLTIGDTKDFSKKGVSSVSEREAEIVKVAQFLKFDDWEIAFRSSEYHLRLDAHGQQPIINLIERKSRISIEKIKPTIVTFPSLYSYNQDHQVVAHATHAALRPAEPVTKHFVSTVLAYEMPMDRWSLNQQMVPNFFVPLTKAEMKTKTHAMSLYSSQMRPAPNPRSLEILKSFAQLRGAHVGHDFAEAYYCYRMLMP
ncbi:TPA: PIG-L family deacetylase [Patescibacteria group bacterium]|uniref:LmbE family protein n=1 Tax=Candidatus Gottesmanbacteria bacterium GW2011_GWA1_43_11 TaxID=1618436 RepID=A0A0G1CIZ5_9BACT|nr:MAG: hypothetical protein UV59_C0005G0031 [Candidatus Gottesmanbacteria bacterium GW2011_GWA1_43_11]HCS78234.1 PIG-L family deacetylase [Patescibacteria group bacterium]